MMTETTLTHELQQLKLTGMAQAFTEQMEQPSLHDLSFMERLALLVDRESLYRTNRRTANLLRQAKLRQNATSESIDYQHPRQLSKSQFMELLSCDFIRKHHNLLMTGSTGCGKSFLACAIGHHACRQGLSVRYWRLPRLSEELTVAQADGRYSTLFNQLLKIDLLILDDFGLQPSFTPNQRRDFFNLIEDRHQVKSTLITSQLPVKQWHDYIGEPTLADAVLDRLLQNAHRLDLKGDSLRRTEITLSAEAS